MYTFTLITCSANCGVEVSGWTADREVGGSIHGTGTIHPATQWAPDTWDSNSHGKNTLYASRLYTTIPKFHMLYHIN